MITCRPYRPPSYGLTFLVTPKMSVVDPQFEIFGIFERVTERTGSG
jgi:hypothetical protein